MENWIEGTYSMILMIVVRKRCKLGRYNNRIATCAWEIPIHGEENQEYRHNWTKNDTSNMVTTHYIQIVNCRWNAINSFDKFISMNEIKQLFVYMYKTYMYHFICEHGTSGK